MQGWKEKFSYKFLFFLYVWIMEYSQQLLIAILISTFVYWRASIYICDVGYV